MYVSLDTFVPQSVSRRACYGKLASILLCSYLKANCANESCFGGMITYSTHSQIYLHNCMRHNTPLYTFNKENMEHLTRVKQGHVKCLASLFGKDDVTFRSFPKILDESCGHVRCQQCKF